MRTLQSLSFRLALTYIGLFSLSVAALFSAYYWVVVAEPLAEVKRSVDREMQSMSDIYIVDGAAAVTDALSRRAADAGARKAFHAFIDGDGKVVASNLPSWPKEAAAGFIEIEADLYRDGDEEDYRALSRDRVFRDGARLLVGRDAEDIDERRELVASAAAWIFGVTIFLGVIGGVAMSRAIGRRIETINRAARTVIEGDLTGRVPVTGAGDDFDRLGETLNFMLGRIGELLESVRRVSDNVAHELRTPLTRLLVRLEALESNADPAVRRRLVSEAAAEARRLNKVFDAVLRIARIEGGRHATQIQPADLRVIIDDATEFYAPDAELRSIDLGSVIGARTVVRGDPDLLFQAVSNLIDNALKYTPPGGAVVVKAQRRNGAVVLTVADNGPGVSDADRARATERFFRSEKTASEPGEGLGLSLVAAIANLHRATLSLKDNDPGLRVEMSFEPHQAAD